MTQELGRCFIELNARLVGFLKQKDQFWKYTPLKMNMEPEYRPIEEDTHIQHHYFWVPCWFSGVYDAKMHEMLDISAMIQPIGDVLINLGRTLQALVHFLS